MASLGDFNTAPQSKLGQVPESTEGQASPEFMKKFHAAIAKKSSPSYDVAGRVKDVGIDALKGAVSLSQVPLGLGDMMGLGATKAAEQVGIQTNKTQDILSSYYSEGRKKSEQEIADTKGALNRAKSYLTHPASLVGGIEQSIPLMLPGVGVASKLGSLGKAAQIAAGAVGEGAVTTGLKANEAESRGVNHDKYAIPALEAGIGTAAIAGLTGGLLGDAATNVLRGVQGNKGVEVAKSLFSEGLQESAQSGQEKMQDNRIYDRPLMEGVPEEMGAGAVMGAAMGGGMTAVSRNDQGSDSSATEQPLVNPTTDTTITNPEINTAFRDYNVNTQRGHSSTEEYSTSFQRSNDSLDSVINNSESSPSDIADAKAVKDMINQGHSSKLKAEATDAIRDSEINAADPAKPESFTDINSMTTEELKQTHEVLYKMVAGVDPAATDELGANLVSRFKDVDSTLKSLTDAGLVEPTPAPEPEAPVEPTAAPIEPEETPAPEPIEPTEAPIDYTAPLFPTEATVEPTTTEATTTPISPIEAPKASEPIAPTPVTESKAKKAPTSNSVIAPILSSKIGTPKFEESLATLDDDSVKSSINVLRERLAKIKTGHGGAIANKIALLENHLVDKYVKENTTIQEAAAIPEAVIETKSNAELDTIMNDPVQKSNPVTAKRVARKKVSKVVEDVTAVVTSVSKGVDKNITSQQVSKVLDDIKEIPNTIENIEAIKEVQSKVPMLSAVKDNPLVSEANQAVEDDLTHSSTVESSRAVVDKLKVARTAKAQSSAAIKEAVAKLKSEIAAKNNTPIVEEAPASIEQVEEDLIVEQAVEDNYARLTDNQFAGESRAILEAIKLHESMDKDASHTSYQITEADKGREAIVYFKTRLQTLANLPLEELESLKSRLVEVKKKRSLEAKRASVGRGEYLIGDKAAPSAEPFKVLQAQVESLKKGLGLEFMKKHKLNIYLMEDATTYNFPSHVNISASTKPSVRGFITGNPNRGVDVFLNANLLNTREAIIGTFAHEIVGHFGMLQVFGGYKEYNNYLRGMLKNTKLRQDILSLHKRWSVYLREWNIKNDISSLSEKELYMFGNTIIPEEVALKLADEYMAELAKAKLLDAAFVERTVGYGNKISKTRSTKRTFRDGILKDYLEKVKYFLSHIFGDHYTNAPEKELLVLISTAIDNTFENLNPDMLAHSGKSSVTRFAEPVESSKLDSDTMAFVDQIESSYDVATKADPEKVLEVNTRIVGDTKKFFEAMTSGFGSQKATIGSRVYNSLQESLMKNSIFAAMTTFGNMPYSNVMQAINTVAKGNMAIVEKQAPAVSKVMQSLNNVQAQIAYEYFTTPNADTALLNNFTEHQRKSLIASKESINKLGKGLVELNPALTTAFAKYEDAYLHTTYFKYLNQYKGSNKTPFGAWMKRKKFHTTQEELMLGMIKDVRFLVPETLGIISRDHTLLSLFDTISKVSSDNNTHWVLNSNKVILDNGMKMNYDEALDKIVELKGYLNIPNMHEPLFSGVKQDQLNKFRERVAKLEQFVKGIDNEFTQSLNTAFQKAVADNTTKAANVDEFLKLHYTRMSENPRNGALKGKTVRNEIFKDLEAYNKAYDLKDKSNVEKFFAEGGTAERLTAYWKLGMIGFNPASIARNTIGNFSLLDLSTSTNSVKLMSKVVTEIKSALNNKHTDDWKLAESYGLFGVTMSAVELQILHNEYSKPLEDAMERWKKNGDSPMESQMGFLNPVLLKLAELGNKSQVKAANLFAFTEGVFKTVAFSDYVERWESQNRNEFPDGAKSLDPEKQHILYTKAALHANDSLIDYSSVPRFIRELRRLPLGSPFITFTYKALPISVKAAITQPLKFAKYAALPTLMTMLAMSLNDWDDDDVDEARRKLPEYYRQSSGVALLPMKDDMGRIQWINFDPIMPWTQWATAARKLYEDYMMGGVAELPSSTLEAFNREGGFLGGPLPQAAAAITTGINTFTGKPIETPGASSAQHLMEDLAYSWNLATPSWIHSSGWLNHMSNLFAGTPEKDKFGEVKNTTTQTLSEITGFKAIPSTKGGESGLLAKYESKLRDLKSYKHKIAKDTNMSMPDKASKIKDSNERLKMILRNRQEEFGK